jgi:2-polyprenyl-3-methyl-5-hydroxy-6-metoxy-1,4-benzoquinol methylase
LQGPFDVVLALDVLDRVAHPEALLAQMHRQLTPSAIAGSGSSAVSLPARTSSLISHGGLRCGSIRS